MTACLICGNPATCRFTVDLDIEGIPSCDACKEDVRVYVMFLRLENEKMAESFLTGRRKEVNR